DRGNHVVEASASIVLITRSPSADGIILWRSFDLQPVRSRTPAFTRTWSVMHVLDQKSPLYGATAESIVRDEAEIVVTLTGMDSTSHQTIHANCHYYTEDIRFGVRHADMMSELGGGRYRLDLSKFDELISLAG